MIGTLAPCGSARRRDAWLGLAMLAALPALAAPVMAEEPTDARTDAAGRLSAPELARTTGWKTLHTLEIGLELKQTDDTYRQVSPGRVFYTGEQFRIRVSSATDLYVYVLVHNADDTHTLLIPESARDKSLLKAGKSRLIPPADQMPFEFQGQTGDERLRVLASSKPLPRLAPRELFKLASGKDLAQGEQDALSQIRSVQSKEVRGLFKKQASVQRVKSIPDAITAIRSGSLDRGLFVVAVEETETAHSVSVASPKENGVVVAELTLTHKSRE